MLNPKLRVLYRAIQIRLKNGEELEAILDRYSRLTEEEKQLLRAEINS